MNHANTLMLVGLIIVVPYLLMGIECWSDGRFASGTISYEQAILANTYCQKTGGSARDTLIHMGFPV